MRSRLVGRRSSRGKKAISAIIGGVIMLSIILTVGFGYFYTTTQDQQILQSVQRQSNNLLSQKLQENLYIESNLAGGNLTFAVNNTGIPSVLVAYFVIDQTGKLVQYASATPTNTQACPATNAKVPCALNPGMSTVFNTNIGFQTGSYYTMKVITNRGTTVVGTYPQQQITANSINTQLASGLGSLLMYFNSFTFYGYTSTSPTFKLNLSSAQPAGITPYTPVTNPIAFSAQLTNNDPSGGTIVVDSHADLWTFLSCGSGCGSQQLLAFYIMNVAPDGTITSSSTGSFVPIQIPYGTSKTIYFGSACDLSISTCSGYTAQSINDAVGEHDVFMIFSGTLVSAKNATIYSQNLPFSATFASDNIANFAETPTTCANGSTTTFNLQVSNSKWSVAGSGKGISQVSINASSFSTLAALVPPNGWTALPPTSGVITWKATNSIYYLQPGASATFSWTGTAPIVHVGTQFTFLSTSTWSSTSGNILSQQIDTGCYVG